MSDNKATKKNLVWTRTEDDDRASDPKVYLKCEFTGEDGTTIGGAGQTLKSLGADGEAALKEQLEKDVLS